jgi:hypothetical protein
LAYRVIISGVYDGSLMWDEDGTWQDGEVTEAFVNFLVPAASFQDFTRLSSDYY